MFEPDPLLTPEDIALLSHCETCPRVCKVNRFATAGACGADARVKIASANVHTGEEPPISGTRGSGTIFFSYCNMHCVYCQNFPISQEGTGTYYTIEQLVAAMLRLERAGVHNINFVTPSHYIVQMRRAVLIARERGLSIPIVYNTSGYDNEKGLTLASNVVQIYLPDLRYFDDNIAQKFSAARDYPKASREALLQMHNFSGDLRVDDNGIATGGVLVRLLVLPNELSRTDLSLRWIAEHIGTQTHIALMSQYFPAHRAHNMPPLDRNITAAEYDKIVDLMDELGFENGFIQPIDLWDERADGNRLEA